MHDGRKQTAPRPAATKINGFVIGTYWGSRYWTVIDPEGKLICVTVDKRGAMEVVRRLMA